MLMEVYAFYSGQKKTCVVSMMEKNNLLTQSLQGIPQRLSNYYNLLYMNPVCTVFSDRGLKYSVNTSIMY